VTTGPVDVLAPYVPRLVAGWGLDGPGHRTLPGSLVSVDISGFTALSERLEARGRIGAEELIRRISECYAGIIDLAHERGGDVLKFRGDALLLFFADEGHERRAVAAASAMQTFVEENGEAQTSVGPVRLGMAAGIRSGATDFFLVGSSHRELIVAGPAASEVLALEDAAGAGEVLVDATTAAVLESDWLGGARGSARLVRRDAEIHAPPAPPSPPSGPVDDLLPGPLRELLVAGAAEPEHRLAVPAFVKFAGADSLIRDERDVAAARFAELGELVGGVADEFGITWLESDIDYDGGKFYLVAGAPVTGGDDEERMLVALRRIVSADVEPALAAGVAGGHVFAGEIGSATRRTYAVMGDTVNLAARLAARAERGAILTTEQVLERSRRRFELHGQPFLMKGKERPVTGYSVGAPLETRERDHDAIPLVDRHDELELFRAAVDDARRRRTRMIELVGEAGIGKSRLVEELKLECAGFQQLVARGEQYASATSYGAWRDLLRPLAGITADADATSAGAHLQAWVTAVMPDLAPWLPLLAIPFGAEVSPTPEAEQLAAPFRRRRLNETVDGFLTRLLLMPTLLVIEDAHWLDEASADLLRHVAASRMPRPWLLCVTRRDEQESFAPEDAVELRVPPLPDADATALALLAAGEIPLSEREVVLVRDRSGGNPLFLRELVAARTSGSVGELPDTVESVITSRIDRLEPVDRLLLRCASVIGPVFDLDLLAEVLAGELAEKGDVARVHRLGDFLVPDEGERLRFRHDLFRAVGYEGLSFARRRHLHGLVGLALERRYGDSAAAVLSLHFFEAGDVARAWRYAVLAGDRAREQYANLDAAELYGRALAAAEELDEARPEEVARVAEALGDVCDLAARYEDAATAYRTARLTLADDVVAQARLLSKDGVLSERVGAYDSALEAQVFALALLDDNGFDEPALRAELALHRAGVHYRQGSFEDCRLWCTRAVEDAERASARSTLAHAYYLLDVASTRLGRPESRYRELALPIYEELGDLVGQARVLNNLGIDAYFEGRWDDAVGFYKRGGEAFERAGDVVGAATVDNNQAEILSDQGRLEDAGQILAEVQRVFRAAGYPIGIAICTSNRGRLAARAGRFDEAHELLEEAARSLEEIGAAEQALETRARIAECLVFEGRHREAFAAATDTEERAPEGLLPLRALLARLRGCAELQDRAPERGGLHLKASLDLARRAHAEFEVALTLLALADSGLEEGTHVEARAILGRLGVVATPRIPMP
jgi:class 3 adenylate cyclase/tetratricopeptide (TPR) repeat protein